MKNTLLAGVSAAAFALLATAAFAFDGSGNSSADGSNTIATGKNTDQTTVGNFSGNEVAVTTDNGSDNTAVLSNTLTVSNTFDAAKTYTNGIDLNGAPLTGNALSSEVTNTQVNYANTGVPGLAEGAVSFTGNQISGLVASGGAGVIQVTQVDSAAVDSNVHNLATFTAPISTSR